MERHFKLSAVNQAQKAVGPNQDRKETGDSDQRTLIKNTFNNLDDLRHVNKYMQAILSIRIKETKNYLDSMIRQGKMKCDMTWKN